MLSFQLLGLSTSINVPVAHFLVKDLKAGELTEINVHVIKKIEAATGLKILRLVADNHSTNVKMFTILNNGVPPVDRVLHPADPSRWLFVSFDYCHILKNWRNQWLDRDFIMNGVRINADPLLKLLTLQHKNLLQLAYKLTNKHLYPNNLERQKVQPAVDIFQLDVVAALRTCSDMNLTGFCNIEETVRFQQLAGK